MSHESEFSDLALAIVGFLNRHLPVNRNIVVTLYDIRKALDEACQQQPNTWKSVGS